MNSPSFTLESGIWILTADFWKNLFMFCKFSLLNINKFFQKSADKIQIPDSRVKDGLFI